MTTSIGRRHPPRYTGFHLTVDVREAGWMMGGVTNIWSSTMAGGDMYRNSSIVEFPETYFGSQRFPQSYLRESEFRTLVSTKARGETATLVALYRATTWAMSEHGPIGRTRHAPKIRKVRHVNVRGDTEARDL